MDFGVGDVLRDREETWNETEKTERRQKEKHETLRNHITVKHKCNTVDTTFATAMIVPICC